MNNKDSLIKNVLDFLENNEKVVLITGTNQYEKHKTVIAILNKYRPKSKILFRTNSMANIYDEPFLGWTGCLKKIIKSGETFKISKNYYQVDSFNTERTWYQTDINFDYAILYPIDACLRNNSLDKVLNNLINEKNIKKIFLISWTDSKHYDYEKISKYYSQRFIYDALEENPEYHKRVLDIINNIH